MKTFIVLDDRTPIMAIRALNEKVLFDRLKGEVEYLIAEETIKIPCPYERRVFCAKSTASGFAETKHWIFFRIKEQSAMAFRAEVNRVKEVIRQHTLQEHAKNAKKTINQVTRQKITVGW